MNRAILSGLAPVNWNRYRPELRCVGDATNPPTIDQSTQDYQFGRYCIIDGALVVYEIQFSFVGTFNVGAGDAYLLRLPIPAQRPIPDQDSPVPMGHGMVYFSIGAPFVNVPIVPTLANWSFGESLNTGANPTGVGDPDEWIQCYCEENLRWGSGDAVNLNSNKTASVSHALQYETDGPAHAVETIQLSGYSGSGADPASPQVVMASSTMSITYQGAVGSSKTISWKLRDIPRQHLGGQLKNGALLSPYTPFNMQLLTALSPFGNMFIQGWYRPRGA